MRCWIQQGAAWDEQEVWRGEGIQEEDVRWSGHCVPGKPAVRNHSQARVEVASGGRMLGLNTAACRTQGTHQSGNMLAGLDLGLLGFRFRNQSFFGLECPIHAPCWRLLISQ